VRDIGGVRKVTNYHFGSHGAQRFRTLIVTTNKGANRQIMLPQTFHNGATNCAHLPGCTGYEDRVLIRHSSSPLLFFFWTRSQP
jgi:hypothetical protein